MSLEEIKYASCVHNCKPGIQKRHYRHSFGGRFCQILRDYRFNPNYMFENNTPQTNVIKITYIYFAEGIDVV